MSACQSVAVTQGRCRGPRGKFKYGLRSKEGCDAMTRFCLERRFSEAVLGSAFGGGRSELGEDGDEGSG